jgi:unsaturated rhamnogalacturonyl hydrolase
MNFKVSIIILLSIFWKVGATAQMSEKMARTLMTQHPDSLCYDKTKPDKWNYELGVLLLGIEQVWRQTGDGKYFQYIQHLMDNYIQEDGNIRTYDPKEYNIDMLPPARLCLLLYQQTGKVKYKKAAQQLREQLVTHPRTKEGGFWHKKRYPFQMWLDGLYMGAPFYTEYSVLFKEEKNFEDIVNQFVMMEKNSRDAKTGLLFHAYDESREQPWADKTTGHSPHFWGRAMGWFAIALVDVLDHFPKNHPRRAELVAILERTSTAIVKYQDANSGVWYQVLDKAAETGNYQEASASAMFTYAFLKGVRLGVLDKKYIDHAKKAYAGILKTFVSTDNQGLTHLNHVCSVAGLGGNPYRDGSFQYYIKEPQRTDDIKGAAPFIMASVELERLTTYPQVGKGKTVVLDYYFNNEYRNNPETGAKDRFHYIWEDLTHSGFAWWGDIFQNYGAHLATLEKAPTAENLKKASVYIIVDPDTKKETENPHFVENEHITTLKTWVQQGGVLVLMANDTSNCEITHFNQLANAFGVTFTNKSRNMVKNNVFEQGAVPIPKGNPVFTTAQNVFVKELSVLAVKKPARSLISMQEDIIMATAKVGKGSVFIIGDPWLYNEYVDGRKLPAEYDNFKAAQNLASWLLQKAAK